MISRNRSRIVLLLTILLLTAACDRTPTVADQDPLPSWNDGPAKQAIIAFVEKVTTTGGADFIPPAERIATFDLSLIHI